MAGLAVLAGRRAAERAADAAQDATCAGHHRRFAAIEVENYRRLAAASQEDHATVRAEGDLRLATQVLTAAKDGCEPSGREQSRIDDIRVECHRGVGPLHLYPPPESHPN
jgi:hypothetical protein